MLINKSLPERMREFVAYHKNGDGECNGIVLKAYADRINLNIQQRYELAIFYATTYSTPSAIVMLNAMLDIKKDPVKWAKANSKKLLFISDRRWMNMGGRFEIWMQEWAEKYTDNKWLISQVVKDGVLNTQKALDIVETWSFWGRFSAFLFVETLCLLCDFKATQARIPWAVGDTATSGLLNLYGMDKSADWYDKNNKMPPEITIEDCDRLFDKLISIIKRAGGETNITEVETSLCAYRKFYKGSRYNGYYLDRQLQELHYYSQMPGCGRMVETLYALRKQHLSGYCLFKRG